MNSILEPPAERDLPAVRSARIRAQLLATMRGPAARSRINKRRLAIAVAAAVAAAGLAAPILTRGSESPIQVLAMSKAEMPPSLRDAMRQCLKWNGGSTESVTMSDLALAAQRGRYSVGVFINSAGYFACDVVRPAWWEEVSGGTHGDKWRSREWMPGTTQVMGLSSTELSGGDVMVAGRISDRVHRIILDHGNGRTTTARVERGLFGLISNGHVENNAVLIAYDETGNEIGRDRLFPSPGQRDQCYVDPSGRVIHGDPGPNCQSAEPWTR